MPVPATDLEPIPHAVGPSLGPLYSFENGYLGIIYRREERLMRAWPDPHAVARFGSREWEPFWPRLRLYRPKSDHAATLQTLDGTATDTRTGEKRAAYEALRQTVPTDVAAAVQDYPNHQWAILELSHACPDFLDLVRSNSALAFAVANNQEFRTLTSRTPATQARWHVYKTQRSLLEWLGFPGPK